MPIPEVTVVPTKNSDIVLLRGRQNGNKFFTNYTQGEDLEKIRRSAFDELWYDIVGFSNNISLSQEVFINTTQFEGKYDK